MGNYVDVQDTRVYLIRGRKAVARVLSQDTRIPDYNFDVNGRVYFQFKTSKSANKAASHIGSFLRRMSDEILANERHPEFLGLKVDGICDIDVDLVQELD